MRILLPVLILCLLAGLLPAQEIYVPANTPSSGSGNAIPFNSSFMKVSGGYQALYFAKYLTGKAWRLKELSFAPNFSSFSASTLEIKLSHFTGSALTGVLANNIPNPVTVFSGAFNWTPTPGTWSTIGINSKFVYNGTDNVVMDLRYAQGSGGGSCYYDSGTIPRNWTYGTNTATAPSGSDTTAGIKTRFTVDTTTIAASGSPAVGGTVDLNLSAPGDGGLPYQVASSLGQGPIPIGARSLALTLDGLFEITVKGLVPMIFSGYSALLDTSGAAVAHVRLPKNSALIGVRFYSAFVTLKQGAPFNIQSISPNALVTITK